MVKSDASRDYYADLELTPDATLDDIKKQFKKLALKYHPDRNQGKELEYQPRFQAIQAAHEVLGDPEQRRQYDLNRRRGTVNTTFPRPPPPRRNNPYQAKSDFPPPPRRTAPRNAAPGRDTPPTANTGAERYTHFPKPPPPPRDVPGVNSNAKERANMFNAWQHMNHAQKAQAQRAQGFTPTHSYQGARRPANPPPESFGARPRSNNDPSPPRSAWEEMNRQRPNLSRQQSARVPKRSGFDPSTPDGDETQAGSKMYSSPHFDRDNPPRFQDAFPPPVPPRGPIPTAKQSDAELNRTRSGEETPFTEGVPRQRTPYTTHPGEKTFFSSDRLRRSASGRDWANLTPPSQDASGRRRSSGDVHNQRPTPTENSNGHPQKPQGFRPFVVYSSGEESDDKMPGHNERAQPRKSSTDSEASTTSLGSGADGVSPTSRPKAQPSASWARRNDVSPLGRARSLEDQTPHHGHEHANGTHQKASTFSFPFDQHSFQHPSNPSVRPRASETDIYSSAGPPRDSTAQHEQHHNANGIPRTSSHPDLLPLHNRYQPHDPSPMADPANAQFPPRDGSADETFAADQWSRHFQENSWAAKMAEPQSGQASPTRPAANTRRSRGSGTRSGGGKPAATPQSATVTEEDEEEAIVEPVTSRSSQGNSSAAHADDDAMDIDSGPPFNEVDGSSGHSGFSGGGRASVPDILPPPNPIPPPISRQASGMPPPPPPPPRQSSNISMDSFRHVAPFSADKPTGLRNMGSLSADLPFQSQPAPAYPARPPNGAPQRVELPKPPKPPLPPSKLTRAAWDYYLPQMQAYISAWNKFNAMMVAYFQDRAVKQVEMENGPAGGMVDNWLGAAGETATLGGFDTYRRGLKDDERMRTHWSVANEKHMEAVERHGRLRAMILDGKFKG